MQKRAAAGFLLAIGIFLTGPAGTGYAETDTAYWSEFAAEGKLSDKTTVSLSTDRRFKNDGKEHYYTSTAMELDYEFLPWLEAGAGYKEVFKQSSGKTTWKQENRPYGQAAVKGKIGGWKLKNRFRAERRQKDDEPHYYRFRNKLTIKSPWKWTALEINPYIADEVFVEKKEREGFNENRTSAGLAMQLTERLELDLYFLYNIEKQDREWGGDRIQVIGTDVTFSF